MGYILCGMFFFKFANRTRDSLFIKLGVAFCLFALERIIMFVLGPNTENYEMVFIIRLVATAFIIYAMLDKNRSQLS